MQTAELALETPKQKSRERNYGIDLLRIVSMLMVVLLHVLGKGGVLESVRHGTVKGEIFWSIEIACYCAVNCYALISGYVGIHAKHKYASLISLCLQLAFYAILITGAEGIVASINGLPIAPETIYTHLFPSIEHYWYFSAYFCLFFCMPILNYVIHHVPRSTLKKLAVFVLLVFCGCNLFSETISGIRQGYSFLWLLVLYVLGGYLAKYEVLQRLSHAKALVGYFLCISITIICKLMVVFFSNTPAEISASAFPLINYNSPTIVFAAMFLLALFSNKKINNTAKRVIACLAPLSFGVYLIHCHPYLYGLLGGAFSFAANAPVWLGVIYTLLGALCIFVACLFLDGIRRILFRFLQTDRLAAWLEKTFTVFLLKICKLLRFSFSEEEQ